MTLGERRVRISFNPGGNELVNTIKRASADLIDLVGQIPKPENDEATTAEIGRLKALAMTHVEDAAMWAVKAATTEPI